MEKPTIVFFPGAFAEPSCFDALVSQLKPGGFPTQYVPLPSVNPSCPPSEATCERDVEITRKQHLLPLIEGEGKDVLLFVHSFGGVVGGAAAKGLSKAQRSQANLPGGVIGLIYCAGNINLEGETLLQSVGGAYPPFIKLDNPSEGLAIISPAKDVLYSDCDLGLIPTLEAGMIPHSPTSFETPSPPPAWAEQHFNGRRLYVRTINDQCNPIALQDIWIEKSKVEWQTIELHSGHCPFISKIPDLVSIMESFVKNCEKLDK
ncbi:MAG: hypothetical protein M1821_000392 [Bathelium mastoideum]|nr:MAG: hypothetical protein M1821_000392 [Bathelium mastoideum]